MWLPRFFRPSLAPALTLGLAVATCGAGCGHVAGKTALGPPPALPDLKRSPRPAPQPDLFWEPVESDVRGAPKPIELPLAEGSIARVEGATRVWDQLGEVGRQRLQKDGLVVVPPAVLAGNARVGAFYTQLREQRIPYVITLDALSFAVHAAFERALAEIDETVLAPGLRALLTTLEARLGAEQKGAGTEVGEGLRLARGIVAVANVLAREGGASVPPDLATVVAQEVALVEAHAGIERSPLLGTRLDYASLAPPSDAGDPRAFRALTWLAQAPLLLVGRSEAPGATTEISAVRTHTRAAMLFARAFDREIDPAIHEAWTRLARLVAFLWGPPDDLAPRELAEIAASADVRILDPKHIADVTKIDRLRRRAAKGRLPKIWDGAGAPGVGSLSVRLFGPHAPADSVALSTIAIATKSLPSTLDVAAFLEAKDARAAIRENGVESTPAYEAALAQAIAARPPADAPARHASVYGSRLDVVMTWLGGDLDARRTIDSPAARRASIDSALSAWTSARHHGRPFTRPHAAKNADQGKEIAVTGAPLPAFVEAAPDVIARLVAAAAQMRRGLLALRALPAQSPAMTMLAEVDDVLRIALRVATATTNDEAIGADDVTALAALPARLVRIEGATTVATSAEVLVSHANGKRAALVSTTSAVEPILVLVAEPGEGTGGGGKVLLAAGAHIGHSSTAATLATRHEAETQPHPGHISAAGVAPTYASAFRMVR